MPSGGRLSGRLRPPPSKSLTQRYYNLALLAATPTTVHRPLRSEDCEHFLRGLAAVGCAIEDDGEVVTITPPEEPGHATVHCGASGTMMRFLTATLCVVAGDWRLDGEPRLRQRPQAALVEALEALGGTLRGVERPGFLPLDIVGGALAGGRVSIAAHESSQFVSALLMAGAATARGISLAVSDLVSAPYVALTERAMASFGAVVEHDGKGRLRTLPARLRGPSVTVEADVSAACYPAAGAALTGGEVMLEGIERSSAQGDVAFFDLLADMGATVDWLEGGVLVGAGGTLRAVETDLSRLPDQVPTLAAMAPFAEGTTRIRNVAHLRLKESDRLAAMAGELRRLGVRVQERPDGLSIEGRWSASQPPATAVTVATHDDHRIAMSCALIGLRRPGVSIARPQVVAKSYPAFWSDLSGLLG